MTHANDHHHRVQNTAETRKHQQYLKDIVLLQLPVLQQMKVLARFSSKGNYADDTKPTVRAPCKF